VGGTVLYGYTTNAADLPASIFYDPENPQPRDTITSQTSVTDRNGNITLYGFNPDGMVIRKEMLANRRKTNMEAESFITWTRYNEHNARCSRADPLKERRIVTQAFLLDGL
jgi:hypothetical protein